MWSSAAVPQAKGAQVAAAGGGQRRLGGGPVWVTLVTTTGTRGVGRGPVTYTRAIMHSGLVVMHEFQKKSKKPKKLPFSHRPGLKNELGIIPLRVYRSDKMAT